MKIGILKTDNVRPEFAEEFGEYPDMFMALLSQVEPALEYVIYEVQRGEYPDDLDEVDAYLITGSKAGVYDDLPWIAPLEEFIRSLHRAKKKLVGICFGHQLIAQALGGRAGKSDKGWGVGRHTYTVSEQAGSIAPAGSQFSIIASHQDQVLEPATGAVVLASSDFCPVAMTQLDGDILTFQGHPEFVPGYSRALLDLREDMVGAERYQRGVESLAQPLDRLRVAQWILDFISR